MDPDWAARERQQLEAALEAILPAETEPPAQLHRAMRYSVLGGGKRLRPLLCRAAAEAVAGVPVAASLPVAAAIELVHAYSLIHDDLPALDNDDWRRGRPSCHRQFGEATAILAGDALLTLAFEQLTRTEMGSAAAPLVAELARAAGTPRGMVAGQAEDLATDRDQATLPAIERIHLRKTAALFRAALAMGGIAAGAPAAHVAELGAAGESLGLAFQIVDDVLDVTASSSALGKTAGKDEVQAKATYPAMAGIEASRRRAEALGKEVAERLKLWPASANALRILAAEALRLPA